LQYDTLTPLRVLKGLQYDTLTPLRVLKGLQYDTLTPLRVHRKPLRKLRGFILLSI